VCLCSRCASLAQLRLHLRLVRREAREPARRLLLSFDDARAEADELVSPALRAEEGVAAGDQQSDNDCAAFFRH